MENWKTMNAESDRFSRYWERLALRERAMAIAAPCISWQRREDFNEVELEVWKRTRTSRRILDFGSGDQTLRQKFLAAGFAGKYETFDLSPEFPTTYHTVEEIQGEFDAVFCFEVIEHMPLEEGLALRERLVSLLGPGGWLMLSTPNPACILSPFSRDETHIHLYPLQDLLAWALAKGLEPEARRVKHLPPRVTLAIHLRLAIQRVLCYLVGADRADCHLILARRPAC